jgi:hypothetical protein
MFSAFSYSPEAEKRDYEGVFCPCQISFHHFAKTLYTFLQGKIAKKGNARPRRTNKPNKRTTPSIHL